MHATNRHVKYTHHTYYKTVNHLAPTGTEHCTEEWEWKETKLVGIMYIAEAYYDKNVYQIYHIATKAAGDDIPLLQGHV